jgi:hypothetical protein
MIGDPEGPDKESQNMRRGLNFLSLAVFLFAFAGVAGVAHAEVVQYMSRHPLPKRVGHGFCEIDVPHFHDYPPSDPRLYRQVDGQNYFVGDPTPYGYEGPRYSFYGPHPIADASVHFGGPAYCYINGPHYHWYAPQADAHFEMRGGAYWYTGAYDPVFYADQPHFVVINDVYAPLAYERPVIDVAIAPPSFHAEFIVGGPAWRGPTPVWYRPGPGWHGPGPGPGWHGGPDRREMVMHERHEEFRREEEHRGWEHEHDRGWHGGPPGHEPGGPHGGWHGGPPGHEPGGPHGGFHAAGGPPQNGGGWHGGGAPQNGGGWHGGGAPHQGGGAPHAAGGHGNGFHR